MSVIEQYQLQHQAVLKATDSAWLKRHRLAAFENFIDQGIPSTAHENWKYTPLRLWLKNNFYHHPVPTTLTELHELQLFSMLDESCHDIVLVDGLLQPKLSTQRALPIQIMEYARAVQEEKVQHYLGQAVQWRDHPFACLCDAIAEKGLVLIVPENTVIEHPIHILYVTTKNSENCVNHLRNLLIIGKNSNINIIEHYVNLQDVSYFNNIVTEVVLEKNARLSHYKLEQEGNQSFHIGGLHVKQMQGAQLTSDAVTLSGYFSRHDVHTYLHEPHASAKLNGLYFTRNQQHVDYHTLIQHEAPHCTSSSLYKGILTDRSVGVFNGKIMVNSGAQKTAAKLYNHNLLLSDHCEVNSKPELEIYTDDVQCAHGATTGQLDKEALFFLQSRGIANSKARRMLIRAFANDIFNQMSSKTVRDYCQRYLEMAAYE